MTIVRNGDVGDWRLGDEPFLASFRLPSAADKCESLASRNPFPREGRILFNETQHVYTVDGVRVPRSVTGLVHKFVESFDPRHAIEAMQNGAHWEVKRQSYTNDAGNCWRLTTHSHVSHSTAVGRRVRPADIGL